jgi:hypothetical protein
LTDNTYATSPAYWSARACAHHGGAAFESASAEFLATHRAAGMVKP